MHSPRRAAAILAITLGATACSGPSAKPASHTPNALEKRLLGFAQRAVAGYHTKLLRADAVESTHRRAVQYSEGALVMDNDPVWLIQLQSRTTMVCDDCSRPRGARAPTGRVIQMILDAKTFDERDGGLVHNWLDLSPLGHVIVLQP